MGLLDRGAAVLGARMKLTAGRPVTYRRAAGGATVATTAWVGNTLFSRNQTEQGAAVIWGDRDYLMTVGDFSAMGFGVGAAPALGDRITETIAGVATTFEVATPDTGEPCWRYADELRTMLRLHTKRV